jgi:hypothetical protein
MFLSPIQILEKQKLDLEKQKLDLEKQKLDYNLISNVLNNELYIDTVKEILNNNLPLLIKNNNQENNNQENKLNILNKSRKSIITTNFSETINSLIGNNINIIEPYIDEEISIDDIRELEKNETTNPNYNMNINFKIKGKKPKGQKIQKIDPDNFQKIIEVYDSMVYALRSPENNGFQRSCIQLAIKKNTIYKGFRWNYVKKNEDPNISKALPTVNFKSKIPFLAKIKEIKSNTLLLSELITREMEVGASIDQIPNIGANDIVSVVCYAPFNVTNTYTKSETDGVAAAAPGLRMIVPSSVTVGSGSGSANAAGFVTFSGASSVSLNSVFSSTYDNYKIVFTLTSVTADTTITAKVRSGVTDNSATLYSYAMPGLTNGGSAANESSGPTSAGWLVTYSDSALSHYSSASIDLYKPFLAVYTSGTITMTNSSFSSVLRANSGGWWHEVSSSFDGISFISSSGTITGSVSIYGYKD